MPVLLAIVALVIAIPASALAAKSVADRSDARGGTLKVALGWGLSSLDPALSGAAAAVAWPTELAYDPLIRYASDGSFKPAIATSWAYSKDGKSFKMNIRSGMKFADGSPVDADAVVGSLRYTFKAPGYYQTWVRFVTSIKKSGPMAVTLMCKPRCHDLTYLLSQHPQLASIISPAGVADPKKLKTETFGSGPYVLKASESVLSDHYIFEANPSYWNQSRIHFDRVELRIVPDANARLASLKTGQVDVNESIPPNLVKSALSGGAKLLVAPGGFLGILIVDRDGTKQRELRDVRVRQALNYAVDRKAVAKAIGKGYATPTTQITGSASGVYDPKLDSVYPYNPTKAKQLLAQAGYPDGFTLKVETQATQGNVADWTVAAISYFEKIGVKVDLTTDQTPQAWVNGMRAHKYPVASYIYGTLPYAIQANDYFDPKAGGVYNPWTLDPKAAALFTKAKAAPPAQALAYYKALNKFATMNAFAIPLAQTKQVMGFGKNVRMKQPANTTIPEITEVTPR